VGGSGAVSAEGETLELDGRAVALTNLERVLWPSTGFTKGRLIEYYVAAAPLILPHIRGHGLTLARYPQGVRGRGFAQTECRGRPEWMATQEVRLANGELRIHCVVDDAAGLAWVANQNAIELHPFLAPASQPRRPDALVFDLDPSAGDSGAVAPELARRLREELAARGLASFVKTSGARGLHVYAPLGGTADFERCKDFARGIAARLAEADPDHVTDRVGPRRGDARVLIDWTRMTERATVAVAYSLRAMSRPTVSMPLRWEELDEIPADQLWFEPDEVPGRAERHGDPFAEVARSRQELPVPG
jgi:bifunctional non-homologous end joining protein LigD